MNKITVKKLIEITDGIEHNCESIYLKEISMPVIDSRNAFEGCAFFAFSGERTDGRLYIDNAFKSGALIAVCEGTVDTTMPYISVSSVKRALMTLAEVYRSQFEIDFIGVSGSAGKTSAKEMLYAVLSQKYNVLKTDMNHNNDIGVALTLCALNPSHEVAVVEMGISDFGEMDELARMVQPTHFLITNIGQAHLEKLLTREGIFKAKTEFIKHMRGVGRIYANGDDDILSCRLNGARFYGTADNSSVKISDFKGLGIYGCECRLSYANGQIDARLSVPGEFTAMNAAAGALVGLDFGLSADEIRRGLAAYTTVGNRMKLIEVGGLHIISDCYNANPLSMKASLKVLGETQGRRVAILGDMFELGKDEQAAHMDVGRYAQSLGIDLIIAVGRLAKGIYAGACDGNALYFESKEALIKSLRSLLCGGDVVLVKASHSMGFETVVDALVKL